MNSSVPAGVAGVPDGAGVLVGAAGVDKFGVDDAKEELNEKENDILTR